jgi:NTP pyrophosphatase (non-canonical NTP hydrolase)
MELNEIQKKLWEWENKHFPDAIGFPEQQVLGMCEEVGEISHMILKSIQKYREGRHGLTEEVKAEIADGVHDTFVYGLQLLSELRIDIEPGFTETVKKVLERDWNKSREETKNEI